MVAVSGVVVSLLEDFAVFHFSCFKSARCLLTLCFCPLARKLRIETAILRGGTALFGRETALSCGEAAIHVNHAINDLAAATSIVQTWCLLLFGLGTGGNHSRRFLEKAACQSNLLQGLTF